MNPVLRRVLERIPRELPVYDSWEIGHYALRRLYEMDASSVATILQKAFLAGNGRFAEFARREFPASELPGADEAISRLLDAGASTGMRLAAKFASPRLAGRLSALSQNDGNCTKRTALAAYLARTAPAEGLELVQGFLQEPGGGCFRWVLEEAARASWTPAMEQLAMTALGSANPDIEGAAAAALSAHGSESAEGLLWAALERWSAKRKDRAAGVAPRATGIVAYDDETRLGEALFRSLADARGWVFDEPHRKRAQALCAAGSCGPYSLLGQRRPAPIQILPRIGQGDSWVDFEVEGYCAPSLEDLETKLSHYPAGTVFSWWPDQGGDHPFFTGREQKKIFDELSGFLAAHGMTISERQP